MTVVKPGVRRRMDGWEWWEWCPTEGILKGFLIKKVKRKTSTSKVYGIICQKNLGSLAVCFHDLVLVFRVIWFFNLALLRGLLLGDLFSSLLQGINEFEGKNPNKKNRFQSF